MKNVESLKVDLTFDSLKNNIRLVPLCMKTQKHTHTHEGKRFYGICPSLRICSTYFPSKKKSYSKKLCGVRRLFCGICITVSKMTVILASTIQFTLQTRAKK